MWFDRAISEHLRELVALRPVTLLTGARQAGKTSLLRQMFPEFNYVSLDLPTHAQQAEEDGERFLERHPAPLLVDEVQYAPKLLRFIKAVVDSDRDRMGHYLLTGSQKFSLMQGVTESLAGRLSLAELHPLSLGEFEQATGQHAEGARFWHWLFTGGYPDVHARGLTPERFYSDYVATYLERDVRQVLGVRSLRDFEHFLRLAALRTGQLLNASTLAGEVGVAASTIRSWLSVLEASNIIRLLPPYHRNVGKRLVKTPKLYFLDTGLVCFLTGIRHEDDLAESALRGPLFETQVVSQLVRFDANHGHARELYFYRDHHGTEVDLVIPVAEKLHLIECKVSETTSADVPAFERLEANYGAGSVLSRTLITPRRGVHHAHGVRFADCVDFAYLDARPAR